MKDDIWKDLTEAKFTQIYTEKTCQFYRRAANIVSIFTIVFSSGGVIMGAGIWKIGTGFPFIACIIIAAVNLLKLVTPKLFPSDIEYKKLNDVIGFYFNQYHELHMLWHEVDKNEIDEKEARKRYFRIVAKEKAILNTVNDVLADDNKKRIKEAENATHLFFNSKFDLQ